MNDTKIATPASGSVKAWLRTGLLAKLTGFMLLGAQRVILSWDAQKKTVTLSEVDENNNITNTIFNSGIQSITRATFFRENFYIRINNVRYDLSLRDDRVNEKASNDLLQLADTGLGGLFSAYVDMKSEIKNFQTLLKENKVKDTRTPMLSTRKYLWVLAIILVAVIVVSFSLMLIKSTSR